MPLPSDMDMEEAVAEAETEADLEAQATSEVCDCGKEEEPATRSTAVLLGGTDHEAGGVGVWPRPIASSIAVISFVLPAGPALLSTPPIPPKLPTPPKLPMLPIMLPMLPMLSMLPKPPIGPPPPICPPPSISPPLLHMPAMGLAAPMLPSEPGSVGGGAGDGGAP